MKKNFVSRKWWRIVLFYLCNNIFFLFFCGLNQVCGNSSVLYSDIYIKWVVCNVEDLMCVRTQTHKCKRVSARVCACVYYCLKCHTHMADTNILDLVISMRRMNVYKRNTIDVATLDCFHNLEIKLKIRINRLLEINLFLH